MEKKLYRSRDDRMIAGVCGGLAEYLDVDPTLVRVATVVLAALTSGWVVVAYIVLMIVVPEEPAVQATEPPQPGQGPAEQAGQEQFRAEQGVAEMSVPTDTTSERDDEKRPSRGGAPLAGLVLIALGVVFLLDRLVPGFSIARYWPVLLIILGIWIMVRPREGR